MRLTFDYLTRQSVMLKSSLIKQMYLEVGLAEGGQGRPALWQVMKQAGEVHEVALPIEGHHCPVAHKGVAWRSSYSGQQLQSCELYLGMHMEPWCLKSLHASS